MAFLALFWNKGIATAQSAVPGPEVSSPLDPGMYELTLPSSDRRYTLVIPETYTGQEPVPLVMSLHYGGQVTPFYGRGLIEQLIEPVLRDLDAIIVAPDNVSGGWANPQAEEPVLGLLDYIEANYNIDLSKTLLTGYSMGATGTWYLAPRHAERFEAAVPMAGRPPADSASFDWQTPVYVIHSKADELIPFQHVQSIVEQLQTRGASIEIVIVDEITHYQVPRYRPHLRAAIPWIRQVWSQ